MERAKGFEAAPASQPVSVETGVILHESTSTTRFALWLARRLTPFFRSNFVMRSHAASCRRPGRMRLSSGQASTDSAPRKHENTVIMLHLQPDLIVYEFSREKIERLDFEHFLRLYGKPPSGQALRDLMNRFLVVRSPSCATPAPTWGYVSSGRAAARDSGNPLRAGKKIHDRQCAAGWAIGPIDETDFANARLRIVQ